MISGMAPAPPMPELGIRMLVSPRLTVPAIAAPPARGPSMRISPFAVVSKSCGSVARTFCSPILSAALFPPREADEPRHRYAPAGLDASVDVEACLRAGEADPPGDVFKRGRQRRVGEAAIGERYLAS